jgi:uncharacterized protein YcgI (DUF1989 family)
LGAEEEEIQLKCADNLVNKLIPYNFPIQEREVHPSIGVFQNTTLEKSKTPTDII